jgi:mannose-6-phosphate isomerase
MADAADFLKSVDKSTFSVEPTSKRVDKPWGYELLLTAGTSPYTAKIIHINAGARLSLQAHDMKTESWTVMSGRPGVIIENSASEMVQIELETGIGYTSAIGQKHRLIGITECDVFEASTPEIGVTLRLEDDYARPDETEQMRSQPGRGWKAL